MLRQLTCENKNEEVCGRSELSVLTDVLSYHINIFLASPVGLYCLYKIAWVRVKVLLFIRFPYFPRKLGLQWSPCFVAVTMGRRKSNRKPPPKRKAIQPLDTQFNCPFCNHEKSCEVKMDKSRNTARICCRVCLEDFQTSINILSEAVDVYNDWIDACENAN